MYSFIKPFKIRIPDTILDKIEYISKKEHRSSNRQIEFIEEYEKANGKIEIDYKLPSK